jgi:hypothetical protein
LQLVGLMGISGTEDAYTVAKINGDATNGLDCDITRIIPGTAATNLGKSEDAAHASGDVGVMALTVRQDTAAALGGTDGDYQPPITDASGRLWVNASGAAVPVTDNGGSLTIDNAALSVTGGGVEASALRVTIASDSTGVLSVDDNGSTLSVDDGGASITVDGTVAVSSITTSVTPGTAAGHLGKAEDAAHASGDTGVLMLAVRRDTAAVGSDTDGDNSTLNVNSAGRLYTAATVDAALPAGNNNIGDVDIASIAAGDNNIGNVDIVTMPNVTLAAGTNTNEVVGDAAHDAAIAGNPLRIAGRALTSDYTAVAAGDTADLITTLLGKLVTMPYANPANTWSYAAASGGITNTTGVTAKAAAGAGVRNYITSIQVINGHATTDTDVQVRDGASGTVLHRGFAKAAGGGYTCKCDPPIKGTANTLIEVACGTTGAAVYVNLQGFTAAEG